MVRAIGIDVGTNYSRVGSFQNGKFEIIFDEQGNRSISSYVAFTDRECLVGDAAKRQAIGNLNNTVFDVLQSVGRKFEDLSVRTDIKYWPFKVVNCCGKPKIQIEYKEEIKLITPEEILAMILAKLKEISETYLGEKVSQAVVAVPCYFKRPQRQAVIDAGVIANLNILRIINNSSLVSLAYHIEKQGLSERNVLIFDLDGDALNVSVVITKADIFDMRSAMGDIRLGGREFDNRIIEYFIQEFQEKHGKSLFENKRAIRRLCIACENVKRELSSSLQASIEIKSLYDGIDFNSTITRTCFEKLCADLFKSILKFVKKALRDAKMTKGMIEDVILIGGSTRVPKIQELLGEFFNGKELNKSMKPEESVVYGAAIQAAILIGDKSEEIKDMLLLDIVPHSLGIETATGVMTPIMERNILFPTRAMDTFTTFSDNQSSVSIRVFEGEHHMVKDNYLLDEFVLSGIPLAQAGISQVDILFDIDANSTLNVTARNEHCELNQERR